MYFSQVTDLEKVDPQVSDRLIFLHTIIGLPSGWGWERENKYKR